MGEIRSRPFSRHGLAAGTHRVELAAPAPFAPGVYYMRLTAGAASRTRSFVVVRRPGVNVKTNTRVLVTVALAMGLVALAPAPHAAADSNGIWTDQDGLLPHHGCWAYDSMRNRVVFVGNGGSTPPDDGSTYIMPLSAEVPRWEGMLADSVAASYYFNYYNFYGYASYGRGAYDVARDRIIAFGGPNSPVSALSFTGFPTWSRLTDGGGPTQSFACGILDAANDRLIVFGGMDGSRRYTQTLSTLTLGGGGSWTPLVAAGTPPPPRTSAAALYDPHGERMIVFGGSDSNYIALDDLWELTLGATPTWSHLQPLGTSPSPRWLSAVVYDAARGRMILFGGSAGDSAYDDTWALSLDGPPAWTPLSPQVPASPVGVLPVLAIDPSHDRVILYDLTGTPNYHADAQDSWQLPLATGDGTWSPLPRQILSWPYYDPPYLLNDTVRRRLILVGTSDLWTFALAGEGSSWVHETIAGTAPNPFPDVQPVFDHHSNRVLLFGGNSQAAGNQTWALSFTGGPHWEALTVAGALPTARRNAAAIYDPVNRALVIFGGTNAAGNGLLDTWRLSFAGTPTWSQLTTGGSPPATSICIGFSDFKANRLVVISKYGGDGGWCLPLGNVAHDWFQPAYAPPPEYKAYRQDFFSVFDSKRRRIVEFGGRDFWGGTDYNDHSLDETWSLWFGTPGWLPLTPQHDPGRRYGASWHAVYDSLSDRMIVLGGTTYHGSPFEGITLGRDYLDLASLWFGTPVATTEVLPLPTAAPRVMLCAIHPNPGAATHVIDFELPADADRGTLDVYSVTGQRVWTCPFTGLAPGRHHVDWNGRSSNGLPVPTGVYFVRLVTPAGSASRRLVRME